MYLAAFTLDFTLVAHRKFCQHINFIDRFMGNTYGCSTKNTGCTYIIYYAHNNVLDYAKNFPHCEGFF